MALKGVKVVEMAGLAPVPFAGMVLADFGADVVRVDRADSDGTPAHSVDTLSRGKRSVAVDLKSRSGRECVMKLVRGADVLIEPFRPGVMERLGLGPDVLCKENPRLIYTRLTGYGQGGRPEAEKAPGHDINYLAQSGVLSMLKPRGFQVPVPPINLLADFAGGGLSAAFGIVAALYERETSGKGQVIDAAMSDGAAYVSTMPMKMYGLKQFRADAVGENLLDGGAPFYRVYTCKCGGFMSVGALEPQFYKVFIEKLGVANDPLFKGGQMVRAKWAERHKATEKRFNEKTVEQWTQIFKDTESCVWPVLTYEQAPLDAHNVARKSFFKCPAGHYVPAPAPRLSRTPAVPSVSPDPKPGQHQKEIMAKL
ncbi:Isopenicillin N epimerase component 2 [Diplonema papillatum]|nr:Isopenicillin N epimerase component 2 [Diplonema papillatum]|eukprot:gene19896-30600_t